MKLKNVLYYQAVKRDIEQKVQEIQFAGINLENKPINYNNEERMIAK